MIKTQSIDLSEDRLLAMAADYVEEHNYIGALRMLNKNAELNGNAEDSYMLYAETFDDMGLYEKSVNGWFKYIDLHDMTHLTDTLRRSRRQLPQHGRGGSGRLLLQ